MQRFQNISSEVHFCQKTTTTTNILHQISFDLIETNPICFFSFIFCSKQNKQNLEFFQLDSSEEVSLRFFNLALSLEGFIFAIHSLHPTTRLFMNQVGFAFKRKQDKETFAGAQIERHLGSSEALSIDLD